MGLVAAKAMLIHGYSLANIDHYARLAVTRMRSRAIGPGEAYDEAWTAIAELLYLCPEKPAMWSLVDAGSRAIDDAVRIALRDQGLRRAPGGGMEEAPRFRAYWTHTARPTLDWSDAVAERLALPQVLKVLTPNQYQAMIALAAHGSLEQAANFLGMDYHAFYDRIRKGRRRILEAWFEGETPHDLAKVNYAERCHRGHPRARYGYIAQGHRQCRKCESINARHRRLAGQETDVAEAAGPENIQPEPLTFPETPSDDGTATSFNTCWCGLRLGHDWSHKDQGAPHPRAVA